MGVAERVVEDVNYVVVEHAVEGVVECVAEHAVGHVEDVAVDASNAGSAVYVAVCVVVGVVDHVVVDAAFVDAYAVE